MGLLSERQRHQRTTHDIDTHDLEYVSVRELVPV
jgi:hypothetical protein